MRYRGYVVTYVGEKFYSSTENFFLNGLCREEYDDPNSCVVNKNFKSRNIYALSSARKSDEDEGPLSYIAMDILKDFHGGDFDKASEEYFNTANTAITSHVLEKKDSHFEVDISVLSINHDIATVYNMGDVPVLYYEAGSKKPVNLSGKAPESVEVEKNYINKKNEVQTDILTRQNLSHIGVLNSDCEIVPYKSESKRLRKKTYFVLCSKEVLESVGEAKICEILDDKEIKKKDKAIRIISQAVENDPDGNYSVQVVVATPGLAVAGPELRSLGKWLVTAALCVIICLNGDYVVDGVYKVIDACRSFIQNITENEEEQQVDDLRWTPREEPEDTDESDVAEEPENSETQEITQEEPLEDNTDNEGEQTQTPAPAPTQPSSQPSETRPQQPAVQEPAQPAVPQQTPSPEPEPEPPQETPPEDPEIPTQGEYELPVV